MIDDLLTEGEYIEDLAVMSIGAVAGSAEEIYSTYKHDLETSATGSFARGATLGILMQAADEGQEHLLDHEDGISWLDSGEFAVGYGAGRYGTGQLVNEFSEYDFSNLL
ncbi:hypothetical protein [Candidatus Nanohalobium constans]|uniref:Uncharacterized protein n=1 Tax=Candidatus Nanohalobium constans TaxID=2565781 RepID=A0A5Q0UFP2_9ARCH|nr:hypothetical protein [Candidatus Nanohalobium constans]QGA80406.1 hypothetical protein LC1Nh_0506 [Candidatus Nanohalobium constans]